MMNAGKLQVKTRPNSSDTLPVRGVLQRKCDCGTHTTAGGECDSCEREKSSSQLQRAAVNAGKVNEAPPIVHDVLRSPGQPLDVHTRSFFEPHFAHDFSQVRVHTDVRAAESARSVHASAYTVGRDVVFASGQFSTNTSAGKRLLAHELTHVVQQGDRHSGAAGELRVSDAGEASERAADAAAEAIAAGRQVPAPSVSARGILHRQLFPVGTEALHRPVIKDFRRQAGLPQGRVDPFGPPVGPTDADIVYELNRPVEDPSRLTIDAVDDFLASSLTAPLKVGAHVNDPTVVSLHWNLVNPEGRIVASTPTTAGQANATQQPFILQPAQFSGPQFVAGPYVLYCFGEDASQRSVIYSRRDFNVLTKSLKVGKALDTTHGKLTFTRYDPLHGDIRDQRPRFEVDVILEFLPNEKVLCNDVAFIQTVQAITPSGESQLHTGHSEIAARQTKLAWSIDQLLGGGSPYYGHKVPPQKNVTSVPGRMGYGRAGSGGKQPTKAQLADEPGGEAVGGLTSLPPQHTRFESCAICRSGGNAGQVYGCATWGFSTDTSWHVKLMPPSFRQMPSEMFQAAGEEWNVWRDKQPAAKRPDEMPQLRRP